MRRFHVYLIALISLVTSCKSKETGPDPAAKLKGEWVVNRIDIWGKFGAYPDSTRQYSYHPADSGHVAKLIIKKINTHNVPVYMSLKRGNGALLYEYEFKTQVAQHIDFPYVIYFDNHPGMGSSGYDESVGI